MINFPYFVFLKKSTAQNAVLFFLALTAQSLFIIYDFLFFSFFLWPCVLYEFKRPQVLAFRFLENGDFFYALQKDPLKNFLWVKAHIHTLSFWHTHLLAFSVRNEQQKMIHFLIDRTNCSKDDFRRLKILVRYFLWKNPR